MEPVCIKPPKVTASPNCALPFLAIMPAMNATAPVVMTRIMGDEVNMGTGIMAGIILAAVTPTRPPPMSRSRDFGELAPKTAGLRRRRP